MPRDRQTMLENSNPLHPSESLTLSNDIFEIKRINQTTGPALLNRLLNSCLSSSFMTHHLHPLPPLTHSPWCLPFLFHSHQSSSFHFPNLHPIRDFILHSFFKDHERGKRSPVTTRSLSSSHSTRVITCTAYPAEGSHDVCCRVN